MVTWHSASGGFAYIWQSKWVGIIAVKTERTQIHFLSDVLVAVASLDLKVPIFLTPIQTLYFYIPVRGQFQLRTPFSRTEGVCFWELSLYRLKGRLIFTYNNELGFLRWGVVGP